jgi:hypothetical protein
MNRRSFLSLAPLIALPEPRRVYSFLWERETERERLIRQLRDAVLGSPIVVPRGYNVEVIHATGPSSRDKLLTLRLSIQPLSWAHAMKLRSQGFEWA